MPSGAADVGVHGDRRFCFGDGVVRGVELGLAKNIPFTTCNGTMNEVWVWASAAERLERLEQP